MKTGMFLFLCKLKLNIRWYKINMIGSTTSTLVDRCLISFRLFYLCMFVYLCNCTNISEWSNLCVIGRDMGIYNSYINGNYTFIGTDPENEDKPYWYHVRRELAIEWGVKFYGSNFQVYMIKIKNIESYAAYCNPFDGTTSGSEPDTCGKYWFVFDTTFQWDPNLHVEYCSWYTKRDLENNCNNKTYLNDLGLLNPKTYCVNGYNYNQTIRTDILGNYTYNGCNSGLPYYSFESIETEETYFLHFDWTYAKWLIGKDINADINDTINTIAFCNSWNLANCDSSLHVRNGNEAPFTLDTAVTIDPCAFEVCRSILTYITIMG